MTGLWGDKFGRRFTYQVNLTLFGLASLASAFAPNMETLIALRFVMGLGLGAENVVGYSIMTEFFPAKVRGRWSGMICTLVTAGLPVSALLAWLLVPAFGVAGDVRAGWRWRSDRLVPAQEFCRSPPAGWHRSGAKRRRMRWLLISSARLRCKAR
ncbi:MAG: MFS transporter [Bradyrhizobium sp.]